jgi:glucose-1-phosphate adenylyltransferase
MLVQQRHISQLTKDTLAFVMAGGRGSRLGELTDYRSKPAVFFGGKFRVIDFPLSNCVNSGIRRIGVLTQYKAHSLIDHLVKGWTHLSSDLGEFVRVLPASQQTHGNWYSGTADSIYQNLDIIRSQQPKYILVLSGDHVYKMDYGRILSQHVASNADVTISCIRVPVATAAGAYGVMTVDAAYRVSNFEEKPARPTPLAENSEYTLASMGNYVFNTEFLLEQLIKDAANPASEHDFGKNIIPSIVGSERVFAFPFDDEETGAPAYWRDIGTLDAYWEANMDLVSITPELNLYEHHWPILTYQPQLPPAKFIFDQAERRGSAIDSMVSGGCIISGAQLKKSLLFSDVAVHSYSSITESLLLPQVRIGRNCRINRAIIDRGCQVPAGTEIGTNHQHDAKRGFHITEKGIVLVTPRMLGQHSQYFFDRREAAEKPVFLGEDRRQARRGVALA